MYLKKIAKTVKCALFCAFLAPLPTPLNAEVNVVAIADIQYDTKPDRINRAYSKGLDKIRACANSARGRKLDFLVNLGDSVDAKYKNLAPVLKALEDFDCPKKHVLGNHDLADTLQNVKLIEKDLGLEEKQYYFFDIGNWRFIFLNTNAVCELNKHCNFPEELAMLKKRCIERGIKYKPYNGGLDGIQMRWLDRVLSEADSKGLNAAMFAHSPIDDKHDTLLNAEETRNLLSKHKSAKIWINGHRHKGGYEKLNGLHLLTLNGMVEGTSVEDASWAFLKFKDKSVSVEGRGKIPSRELPFD